MQTVTEVPTITGYALYHRVNEVIKSHGWSKRCVPQTIYMFMRTGRIPSVEVNGHREVRVTDADAFIQWYLHRR